MKNLEENKKFLENANAESISEKLTSIMNQDLVLRRSVIGLIGSIDPSLEETIEELGLWLEEEGYSVIVGNNRWVAVSADLIVTFSGNQVISEVVGLAQTLDKPIVGFYGKNSKFSGNIVLKEVNDLSGVKLFIDEELEKRRWKNVKEHANAAFDFWRSHMNFRGKNDEEISSTCLESIRCQIRAVSWVESKHGQSGQNYPTRDPMQCGNPNDDWWKTLSRQNGNGDRLISGPGKENYWAGQIMNKIKDVSGFPNKAKDTYLTSLNNGHKDTKFNAIMSYYWGVIYLVHRTNDKTYRYDECSKTALVDGAVNYNGGGDDAYRNKIKKTLVMINCIA